MGFKPISTSLIEEGANFNSAISCNFKDLYDNLVVESCKAKSKHVHSKTFAPSSFRCNRLSYFRLRGLEPDESVYDLVMDFKADLGTSCHKRIQQHLKDGIGDSWISVREYLNTHPIDYEYKISDEDEFETKIEIINPPVRFACDGIIKIGDEFYLLEIKTSEYGSFKKLSEPKPQHVDQIKCYCALLNMSKALVLYQERDCGNTKCFELNVTKYERDEIFKRMNYVLDCVENNIAPDRLPRGDYMCTSCSYKTLCKQWG